MRDSCEQSKRLRLVGLIALVAVARGGESPLGALKRWDDGLARIDYYDARRTIYRTERRYTRVQIMVREYLDAQTGVKAQREDAPGVVPVLKLLISEQIPTENYNYRLLTVLHVDRRDLAPFKLVASSQEWCGASFKHLRWRSDGLVYRSFSYFTGEADRTWSLPRGLIPFESVFVLGPELAARLAADPNADRVIERKRVMAPLGGNHQVAPDTLPLRLEALERQGVQVPAGHFAAWKIAVRRGDEGGTLWVEAVEPFRVVHYALGGYGEGRLRFSERRAYWDRNWTSGFHAPGRAP